MSLVLNQTAVHEDCTGQAVAVAKMGQGRLMSARGGGATYEEWKQGWTKVYVYGATYATERERESINDCAILNFRPRMCA